ncbi:MAG: hypothetical protein IT424_01190 [Pirellulales bacterium]|nr:hypothetical protein [Pirellulales bacterium]
MRNTARCCRVAAAVAIVMGLAVSTVSAVEYANINVANGAPEQSGAPIVTIPAGQKTADFFFDPGAVVGEYPIRIGVSAADDVAGGILIPAVRETGRAVTNPNGPETLYASASIVGDADPTSNNTRNAAGGLAIVTDRAGNLALPGSNFPVGAALNANVAAAYFPFSEGWVGGTVSASSGTTLDTFTGSPGFQFGVNVKPNFFFEPPQDLNDSTDVGDHFISIPGVQDTRRQGILFAAAKVNANNNAVASATAYGDGFNITTRGNDQDGGNAEINPFSFVFVPLGTPNVTMGSIFGSTGQNAQPYPLLKSGKEFTVSSTRGPDAAGTGTMTTYHLSINGETPTSGTLIVQANGNQDGDGGLPADNLLTFQPNAAGTGWDIISQDLPGAAVTGLVGNGQNPSMGERQPEFNFIFMPFNAPATAPGPLPALNWTKKSVFGGNFQVVEIDGTDNDQNDGTVGMYINTLSSTTNVSAVGLRLNMGDNSPAFDGVLPTVEDGVMFATISQGLRDNSATGGKFEYGVVGVSQTGSPASWEVHTSVADPKNGEININFAAVVFGKNAGFPMQANAALSTATGMVGHADIAVSGVNSLTDGVLMVTPNGNDDNFATVEPKADGSGWDVNHYDNGTGQEGPTGTNTDSINWIYLPYSTENLVAGRVNADGTLVNSTDTSKFTLSKTAAGEYTLTVNGRNSSQGMLLLNATGPNGSLDNAMVYEAAGNSFKIIGLDMITSVESSSGAFVTPEDTSFSFAFIDFVTPPKVPGGNFLEADFNEDGSVDGDDLAVWDGGFGTGTTKADGDANGDGAVNGADFLVWQQQFGTSPAAAAAAAAVPEPAAAALALCGLAALGMLRRKSA